LEPLDPISIIYYRPDALRVWTYPEIKERLSWYYEVMKDLKPAKFIIAKHIESPINPYRKDLSIEDLWKIHRDLEKEFRKTWLSIKNGEQKLGSKRPEYSFLDVKIAIVKRMLRECSFCEWRCRVDRTSGKKGVCRLDATTYVDTYFHHMGEEAPLVPSGTIFYGGCNFRCVFCQNWTISQANPYAGIIVDAQKLASIQEELRRSGARNINHVGGDPTPNLHTILESLKYLEINVPQLWNSNMYLTREAMDLLKDVIDIWLPDFKYGNNKCAQRLSVIRNYYDIVTRNLKIAYENGDMIIRHLVLPSHIECCTKRVLEWISKNTPRAIVNIMDQYRPDYLVLRMPKRFKEIARRPSLTELRNAYSYARKYGFSKCPEELCFKE